MDDTITLDHIPKERWNYLKLAEYFALTANKLKGYTENILLDIHTRIKEKLSVLPVCGQKCSRRIMDHGKWCDTCKTWKSELESLARHKYKLKSMNWRKFKSWEWPKKHLWIVPIFLNTNSVKEIEDIDLKDLATVLSIWDNCNEYSISQKVIQKLRRTRNKYLAHNSKVRVSDSKMINVYCVLNTMYYNLYVDKQIPDSVKKYINDWKLELDAIKTRKLYEELNLEKLDIIDDKVSTILSNHKDVERISSDLSTFRGIGERLLSKVESIDKKLQKQRENKDNTTGQYPLLMPAVIFVMMVCFTKYLFSDNFASLFGLVVPKDVGTSKQQKNFAAKKDSLSALAADYMCYHYTPTQEELIRNGTLSEAVVCEHVAHQIYASGDVQCGVCKCCKFIPPEFECYHYSLVEKLQIRYTPEKDVCEQIPGRIFTQGIGVCGICWCCKLKLKPYVCYHYTAKEHKFIGSNLTLEKEVCEKVSTRLFAKGDGTCGGCWCCQIRKNLASLQKAINQIK